MKLNKTKKGFTIVELVIVIGVIGILAGILIPTFVNVTQKAEEAAAKSEVANAFSAYIADAADGEVDDPKAVINQEKAEGKTYAIELIKQEAAVLVRDGKEYVYTQEKGWDVAATTQKDETPAKLLVTIKPVSGVDADDYKVPTYNGVAVYQKTSA